MREIATIVSNEEAGAGYRLLRLSAPRIALAARPGQFVHVRVPDFDPVALRRPISICDADRGVLTLLFKVVGRGTEALARVRSGGAVDLMGPLGNGFPEPKEGAVPVLVGGGYGVAPLYFLAKSVVCGGEGIEGIEGGEGIEGIKGIEGIGEEDKRCGSAAERAGGGNGGGEGRLEEAGKRCGSVAAIGGRRKHSAPRPILFVGARTVSDLLILDRFEALGVEVRVATNDGSLGVKGFVTTALDEWIVERAAGSPALEFFACGPAPMLRAVEERAVSSGSNAWLSLDRRMACGVGACFGCTQNVRSADGSISVARVCVDGPVFPRDHIVWDA